RAALSSPGTFAYIERQVGLDVAQHVADLHLPGVGLLPVVKRYYPAGPVAPQVLGFVNVDGVGTTGLERQYDQLLAGSPGERTVELSAQGQEIGGGRQVVQDPQPGSSVVLTIDRDLQFQAQQYLQKAVRQNHAKGGTIVVLDPHTGDVYAMASYPWFDPNSFASSDSTRFVNRAVTDTWEPGSVNKTITAAAALESGAGPRGGGGCRLCRGPLCPGRPSRSARGWRSRRFRWRACTRRSRTAEPGYNPDWSTPRSDPTAFVTMPPHR